MTRGQTGRRKRASTDPCASERGYARRGRRCADRLRASRRAMRAASGDPRSPARIKRAFREPAREFVPTARLGALAMAFRRVARLAIGASQSGAAERHVLGRSLQRDQELPGEYGRHDELRRGNESCCTSPQVAVARTIGRTRIQAPARREKPISQRSARSGSTSSQSR